MENLLKQDSFNFEILDSKENLVQVLLLPNQFLYTEQAFVMYTSSSLAIRQTTAQCYKRLCKTPLGLQLRVKNRKGGVEYIGLSKNSEKIVVINPSAFEDSLIMDKKCVIGYTAGVKVSFVNSASMKHTEWREFKGNGLVFVQGSGGLIEKKLGVDEEFNVVKRNIVVHSRGLKVPESEFFKNLFSGSDSSKQLMNVKGPGSVFFVSNVADAAEKSRWKFYSADVLCVFLVFLFLLVDRFGISGLVSTLKLGVSKINIFI